MRLTIFAGLILGLSLAVQSTGAYARARTGHAASPVAVHVKEVAPWYIAMKGGYSGGRIEGARAAAALVVASAAGNPGCCSPVSTIFGMPRCTQLGAGEGLRVG